MRRLALPVATALSVGLVATLSGCSPAADPADDGVIRVVASTNVYADVARAIVGEGAEVTALISDIAQDPHEYEATARDALAVSRADIVILNGGGYDAFMGALLDAHDPHAIVIDVAQLSGLDPDADVHDHGSETDTEHAEHADEAEHADDAHHDDAGHDADGHDHGSFNEHVWYHLGTMGVLADEISEAFEARGGDASVSRANAGAFVEQIHALITRAESLRTEAPTPGASVAITEPVPLYLLESVGLRNLTPPEFSAAVEAGIDVPALELQRMLALVSDGSVSFLAANEQTVGPQTQELVDAARVAGTPVLSFSELLPEGLSYLQWMSANLDLIEGALR